MMITLTCVSLPIRIRYPSYKSKVKQSKDATLTRKEDSCSFVSLSKSFQACILSGIYEKEKTV